MASFRIPLATYRIQFNREFRFEDALRLVPYLHRLGITDLYASPVFAARTGSKHGYDVVDPGRLNPELGSKAEFERLAEALRSRGMGLILDVVPNHVGIGDGSNRWWQDLLRNGRQSAYSRFFDIDWRPPNRKNWNKVLLPVLGAAYRESLESGALRLEYRGGSFRIAYADKRFPLALRSWKDILAEVLKDLRGRGGEEAGVQDELEEVLESVEDLSRPSGDVRAGAEGLAGRHEAVAARLASLVGRESAIRRSLKGVIDELNGRPGDPKGFDRLDALLEKQAYRLAYWREGPEAINYRRFFNVSDLAAIRVEDPEVFGAAHELVFRLIREGRATGLRIDHPDGLLDPAKYFRDLQAGCPKLASSRGTGIGESSSGDGCRSIFVVAEKILAPDEDLHAGWAVQGTTGYDYLNQLNDLFIDPAGWERLQAFYARLRGETVDFDDVVYESKQHVLGALFGFELDRLVRALAAIAGGRTPTSDLSPADLEAALKGVIASFPVYRTYIGGADEEIRGEDRRRIRQAVDRGRERNPEVPARVLDFVASVLLMEAPESVDGSGRAERRDFIQRFQQLTAPVMAKGVEDTAHYRAYPLCSINEVGGEPSGVEVGCEAFHGKNADRLAHWPFSLLATSTHDTMRSEDVRARINVLSEITDEWEQAILRWRRLNQGEKTRLGGSEAPDANEEYLFYQTVVGAWPIEGATEGARRGEYVERIEGYMRKALREAKVHTSWAEPDRGYERAVERFVRSVLDPGEFTEDLGRFHERVAVAGAVNSLAQCLLKIVSPGTPDFYQGTELWDFSLVDPDNRRPVDFGRRARFLDDLNTREARSPASLLDELISNWRDGRIKQYVIHKSLACRRRHRELFQRGEYLPLSARGSRNAHLCALARRLQQGWVVAAVPRLPAGLAPPEQFPLGERAWREDVLHLPEAAPRRWLNVLTGERLHSAPGSQSNLIDLSRIFKRFPVALLEGEQPSHAAGL
jgi:(1->4)-alpha-D-glucan 1-alpha-D-glucosylmutase